MKMITYFALGVILGFILVFTYLAIHSATPEERTETLFIYGTLENPAIRFLMCRCITIAEPATLTGYQQVGLNIEPNSDDTVLGELIKLSPEELARLDRYEEVPDNYVRKQVTVNQALVWVYIKQ